MTVGRETVGSTRLESDLVGDVEVPTEALYGVHTMRALDVYPQQGRTISEFREFVFAYAAVKKACAMANNELGLLDTVVAEAIARAADEIIGGRWATQFPLDALQGGGGVSTNMNFNEVIANRAEELLGGTRGSYVLVHPNDHVNRSQSTNDTYPTAMALSTIVLARTAAAALGELASAFGVKASEYAGIQRLGRTCLRDALPPRDR